MELVKYDEKIHPEVWLNNLKISCYKNQITKDKDILEVCKSMIHPSINVSEANTFEEILNILKTDTLFTLFKYSVKEKLQMLKFDPENEDHTQFINLFREYCYEAEIYDVKEQKKLLLKKFSKDSFHYYYINNNLEKIKSLNDLIIYFNQSILRKRRLIHFGSCITLKHVTTGRYLTCCDVHYKTGSKSNIVFASQFRSTPNSLWIVSDPDQKNEGSLVTSGSEIYLSNEAVDKHLLISNTFKSPSTGNWEVSCSDRHYSPYLISRDSTIINKTYIKSKEIITLRDVVDDFILHSHEFPFTVDNGIYQEVVGHEGRSDRNDMWCIELFENE
ncbi:hypothetical protein RclHR1_03500008 [Rhizophagus clarus]|uniref:MIR domain-containing protein n=1 Tax=Rhizophagus clarus TaxID=94130 RepID=A0A2Z6RB73_9GLOM|nr:hypothetical protein RclHR1_03500008 [Rhizophagus clarus]GES94862.1 hypothetical protein GLOIN_2v620063 [Rhizophagus clarus]